MLLVKFWKFKYKSLKNQIISRVDRINWWCFDCVVVIVKELIFIGWVWFYLVSQLYLFKLTMLHQNINYYYYYYLLMFI